MDPLDSYPAITAAIGGKQRRLSLEKQWRRAISNRELHRDTSVKLETSSAETKVCLAGDVPELRELFDDLLGPEPQPMLQDGITQIPPDGVAPKDVAAQVESSRKPSRPPKPVMPSRIQAQPVAVPAGSPAVPRSSASQMSRQTSMPLMFQPLARYSDFSGRARRSEFWWFACLVLGVSFTLGGSAGAGASGLTGLLSIGLLGLLIPWWAVTVRRFHDRDLSGWWLVAIAVLYLIPVINVVAAIGFFILLASPGTPGPNRFGADPKNLM